MLAISGDTLLYSTPLFFMLGLMIGFVGAMVGIGGGLIAIPVLVLFFHLPQQLAQGTTLVMIVANVLASVYSYDKRLKIDFRKILLVVVINMLASYLAARLVQGVNPNLLSNLFAVFLAMVASFYVWQTLPRKHLPTPIPQRTISHLGYIVLGLISGSIGGFLGVGGSLIVVPIMTAYFGLKQTTAQGIALAMILPGLFTGLATYSYYGNTDWWIGLAMALGGVLSVRYGVMAAYRLPELILKRLFALVLYGTVVMMLLK